ncbi:uncharacterized protein LOC6583018 [Drosophila mojavensis]|uniref:DUF4729 domain-containing protein n=1 Tax=Drosophila mojavensis TaxID=7230 RepID=B4L0S3_DROMO|nr:uncharacterized protein LOC6583018 [Drosophila mojavensis]EDW19173.2 uncharacterized protein Dmoj_GI11673 [Drosophila mojavensis]
MNTKRNMESPRGRQTKNKDVKGKRKRKIIVQNLSRMPAHCPVAGCSDIIFPSNVMLHMLHKHSNSTCITAEVYDHRPLLLTFDPTGYERGDNYCIAALLYGGVKGKPNTRPGVDNLSLLNSGLLNSYRKYETYLPIMMMACRTTWFAHMKDKQLEREMLSKNEGKGGIYVLWLVSPITTRKVFYTLTIFDRHYISSRSLIRTVRDYTNFQDPSDFLPIDENYIMLRDSDVLELMTISRLAQSKGGKKGPRGIPMELIVYQTPLKHSGNLSSQAEMQAALKEARNMYSTYMMPRTKGTVNREVSGKMSLTRKPLSKTKANQAHAHALH